MARGPAHCARAGATGRRRHEASRPIRIDHDIPSAQPGRGDQGPERL